MVHSPVVKRHADATKLLTKLLNTYVAIHELGYVATEKILVQLKRNDFEPDVAFWPSEVADTFEDAQLFFPAPALVAEVLSPGTEKFDREEKFKAYAGNGVLEYWIVDSAKRRVECYALQDGYYGDAKIVASPDDLISTSVSGFAQPVSSIFDWRENLLAMRRLLTA